MITLLCAVARSRSQIACDVCLCEEKIWVLLCSSLYGLYVMPVHVFGSRMIVYGTCIILIFELSRHDRNKMIFNFPLFKER